MKQTLQIMKVHVLGLGETLNEFKPDGNITIGVNDIQRFHKTDYVVCVDHPDVFNAERLEAIKDSDCIGFYTQLEEWKRYNPNVKIIEFNRGRGLIDGIDTDKFCYSNNSPYVACILAYKLGAKEIVLHGVDFNDHPHLNGASRDKAFRDYKELQKALNKRGVSIYCNSSDSYLSTILRPLK